MHASLDPQRLSFYTFLAILLASLGVALYMVAPYLIALGMGGILALLARPIHKRLERRMRPALAATVVTLGVILLAVGPLLTFTVLAIRQAVAIANALSKIDPQKVRDWWNALVARLPIPASYLDEHLLEVQMQLQESLREGGAAIAQAMLQSAKEIPGGVLQLALASLACFFLLMDGARFVQWAEAKVPLDRDIRDRLRAAFKDTAISVVWASMAAAGTQAALMAIGFLFLGVPAAFLAGGATFVFAWIPLLGSTPVWLAGAIYLGSQGMYVKLAFMLGLGAVTGLVDNFVRPMVLKGRGEMHPLVSLVAIFGGLKLFGFFGVFFGPIIAAVLITLLQVWPIVGRRWGLLVDEPGLERP